ncbi:MAG: hypothetical protein QNJ46_26815 [Leptolyngbyaceae cyanobacterium MO_188.B28]|nr:hypothetical protein [Leptolyngbyaceae cyanobacterium MO_188.B28]
MYSTSQKLTISSSGLLFVIRAFWHLLRHGSEKDKVLLLTTAPPFLPVAGYLMGLLLNPISSK